MQPPISLKALEKQAVRATFADGMWDVMIGCFVVIFAIAPLLSTSLGDFWSSFVFLPFWALVYLAIWLTRKYIVTPRLGTVTFRKARQKRIARFTMVMLVVNVFLALLGLWVALGIQPAAPTQMSLIIPAVLGLVLLAGFSAAAYLLDFPRLFAYGLLLFAAPPLGEWLYQNHGVPHHGYPVVFGFVAGVMILTGLGHLFWLVKTHPAAPEV